MPKTLRNLFWQRWPAGAPADGASTASHSKETGFNPASTRSSGMDATAIGRRSVTQHTRVEWDRAVVLSVARGIEPDAARVAHWFAGDVIHEFGGKTARQLVEEGATARLLDMLVAIRNGQRDH